MTYLTQEVLDMIGVDGPVTVAPLPLDRDRLRRFVHAVMESNPVHWDDDAAAASKYGEVVAPPLWPMHAAVRAPGDPDPLDTLAENPDWDGAPTGGGGLPPLPLPLKRILNGGTEARFYKLAAVGDVVSSQSRYVDISEREGRSGPMVLVKAQTTFRNQHGEVLAVITHTLIRR